MSENLRTSRRHGHRLDTRTAKMVRAIVDADKVLVGAGFAAAGAALFLSFATFVAAPAAPSKVLSVTELQQAIGGHQVRAMRYDETTRRLALELGGAGGGPSTYGSVVVPAALEKDILSSATANQVALSVADPQESGTDVSLAPNDVGAVRDAAALRLGGYLMCALAVALLVFAANRRRSERALKRTPAARVVRDRAGGATPAVMAKPAAGEDSVHTFTTVTSTGVTWGDVAGCEEAVAELSELVMFLKDPDRFTRLGAKPPKGALLTGPPGTGKTLLARAVAGEAGVPFIAVSGSDFVEKYVGVGAKRVRDLFAQARRHEKVIVFIDEIDAVGRRRGGDGNGAGIESENTLIALLAEMDGFTASHVVVLAATNRPDILDPALKRPGRLDRGVEVPNPDRRGRAQILAVHAGGKPMGDDVDLGDIAARTPGFSGADLAALVNEACLVGVRADLDQVSHACLTEAVGVIAIGRARTSAVVTAHDMTVTAWHEAGHTVAAYLQPDGDDPVEVTIVPRGQAGGLTWIPASDDMFLSRRKALSRLVTAMGGRVGEQMLLDGEFTQGASSDLAGATALAQAMVTQYGMSRLGLQVRSGQGGTGADIREVVEELLGAAHAAATDLLERHRDLMAAMAGALLEHETLTSAQIHQVAADAGYGRTGAGQVPQLAGLVALSPGPA